MDTARTPDPRDRDEPVGDADAAAAAGADGEPEPPSDARSEDDLDGRRHSGAPEDDGPVFTVPVPARGARTRAPGPSADAERVTAALVSMPPPSGPPLAPATTVASGSGWTAPTPGYAPWSIPAPTTVAPPTPVAPPSDGPRAAAPGLREEPSDAVSLWNLGLVLLGLTLGYWFFAGIRFLSYLVQVGPTDRILIETVDMVAVETVAAAVVSVLAALCLGLSRMKRERLGGRAAAVWAVGLSVLTVLAAVWRLV